jgi:hypothetical protein
MPVRMVGGKRYEINSSLPFICSLGVGKQATWQRILLIIALTGFIPGTPYFYLPFILCDIPEIRGIGSGDDPRSLNRTRLLVKNVELFLQSKRSQQLQTLLSTINLTRLMYADNEFKIRILSSSDPDSLFAATRSEGRCLFACNFNASHSVKIRLPKTMKLEWGSRASNLALGPLGFGVWVNE